MEQARAEAAEEARDPCCPERHTRLPDHQRLATLRLLHTSIQEVVRELSALPVAQDTLRVRARRAQLEDKLLQLEDGVRIFTQPVVYVMTDD
ncbi:uncharacterized protein LOC125177861 [Hyalella azteca]|uniref:Uncharacterized protein LOC125177861 n=1 Tax=Hyalella azteca TaxID=294128 RepID=A0A979FJ75_HYAAZ|nr:uncharacterized protein LOC125177861 [Hyalella azteca]